jgi:hypothetical protein
MCVPNYTITESGSTADLTHSDQKSLGQNGYAACVCIPTNFQPCKNVLKHNFWYHTK